MPRAPVTVVGAGLAGCEAAWQLASRGIYVRLVDMKPERMSPAHGMKELCELVCSNSLKATTLASASGLLKAELRALNSFVLKIAERNQIPAGGALAVDRERFAKDVTAEIRKNPLISIECEEIQTIPNENVIIATGPLTSGGLVEDIKKKCGQLHFFDASSPIVTAESVDMSVAFIASRYSDEAGDYINCPFGKEEYLAFVDALVKAETVELKEFEDITVFEGCMPAETLAKRGTDSLAFGPMRPVGLVDPKTGRRPYANVQLRKENAEGTLYNLVGFQTNLKWPEQKHVFSMIPGLNNAEFVRYGVMHRNSYIQAPNVLTEFWNMRDNPRVFFAGQITGVEGYMESAASGLLAGVNAARLMAGQKLFAPDIRTMLGALTAHVSNYSGGDFQPMNCNFGILPPLENRVKIKRERYAAYSARSLDILNKQIAGNAILSNEDEQYDV